MRLWQKSTPDRSAESMSRYCPMPSSIYFSLWRCSMENGLDSFARNGKASGNGFHFRDWMEFCLWRNPGKHLHGLYHSGLDCLARNGMGSNGGPFGNAEEFPYSLYCSGLDCLARNGTGANTDFSFRDWMGANSGFHFWDWIVSGSGFWFWLTTGNRPFHPFGPSRVRMHVQNVQHPSFRTRLQQKSLSPPGDFDSMEKTGDGRKWRT